MNVIVSNRQKEIIDNANIDAIKDLNGLFNVNDLINKFKNYFFSKMILDATSVVDFASKEVLTTLANEIGAEKLIILLPATPEPPEEFKKLLIELKIYNFTNDINDVIRFIEKSNTYEDAIKLLNGSYSNDIYVDNSIKEGEDNTGYEEEKEEVEESKEIEEDSVEEETTPPKTHSLGDILNNLNLGNTFPQEEVKEEKVINNEESNDLTNIPVVNNIEETKSNENKNVFLISDDFNNDIVVDNKPVKKVIGIKNVTLHAGSTSLIYMLYKALVNMNKSVLAIEVNKNDFRLFRDNKMISVTDEELNDKVNNSNEDIILIDLNDNNGEIVNDILYLVEPSTIKLNGLMATNRNVFKELKDKKVILNKSLLSTNDVKTLESEAGISFLTNIGPLNDRIINDSIVKLLGILGVK